MDTPAYVALSRQRGLFREMQSVANNLANISTTGFRREGVVFAEMVSAVDVSGGSISMTAARARFTAENQGALTATGAPLDLAIEGPGYFSVMTPSGIRLTRAGAFSQSATGEVVTLDGNHVLDSGGAPVFLPADARNIAIAADGTVSADGQPIAQIGVFEVENPLLLQREGNTLFRPESELLPSSQAMVMQGFLESSNVEPVSEIARMVMVQRQYELGQNFLNQEDDRIRGAIRTLG